MLKNKENPLMRSAPAWSMYWQLMMNMGKSAEVGGSKTRADASPQSSEPQCASRIIPVHVLCECVRAAGRTGHALAQVRAWALAPGHSQCITGPSCSVPMECARGSG